MDRGLAMLTQKCVTVQLKLNHTAPGVLGRQKRVASFLGVSPLPFFGGIMHIKHYISFRCTA